MNLPEMSAAGGVLILAAALLRALALNRLPKSTFLCLWGLAVLRLLLPVRLPSAFSVYTLTARFMQPASPAGPVARFDGGLAGMAGDAAPVLPFAAGAGSAAPPSALAAAGPGLLFWLWLAGALICGAYFAAAYLCCRREFAAALPVQNEQLAIWLKGHGLRRTVQLRQTGRLRAPLTCGVFRPVILLPAGMGGAALPDLSLVLEHELEHIRHLDALWKLVLVLAACVHWFNPLVWYMLVLAEKDIELRCDECVLRRAGGDRRAAYARMLIKMEEKKSGVWPLANAFGKNAVEERILSVMKYKKRSLAALLAAAALVLCVGLGFATTAAAQTETLRPEAPSGEFTQTELDQLAGLWLDGYEALTVAEYQQRMWAGRDTPEMLALADRYGRYLAQTPGTELTAAGSAFAEYFQTVYEPLTAEHWQEIIFSQSAGDRLQDGTAVLFEYTCYMSILAPEALTVGEYRQARANVEEAAAALAGEYLAAGPSEPAKERGMQELEPAALAALENTLSSDRLQVRLEGGVLVWSFAPQPDLPGQPAAPEHPKTEEPLPGQAEEAASVPLDSLEQREFPQASEADYNAFFTALQTEHWQQLTLAEFDRRLLDWANANSAAYDRINCDVIWNDYGTALTEEQKHFVSLTCALSGAENGVMVRALHTGRPEDAVRLWASLPMRTPQQETALAWCDLYYDISYRISDKTAMTVAERDACAGGMLAEITQFWQETDIETLLQMTEQEVVEQFRLWAGRHSTEKVWFEPITADDIHFEALDERGRALL